MKEESGRNLHKETPLSSKASFLLHLAPMGMNGGKGPFPRIYERQKSGLISLFLNKAILKKKEVCRRNPAKQISAERTEIEP